MISLRLLRKLAAGAAILGMLFTQFAVAAYACPAVAGALEANSLVIADEAESLPCQQSMGSLAGLCKAHCEDGQKNVTGAPHMPPADFVPAFAVTLQTQDVSQQAQLAFVTTNTVPPPQPPVHLRNCVFRI